MLKPVYYQFGVDLGIPPSDLDAVKKTNYQDLDQALTEVLLLWLRRHSTVPPTWQSLVRACLLYTSPSPRDATLSRMPSSA